jgi:hypothetical protein
MRTIGVLGAPAVLVIDYLVPRRCGICVSMNRVHTEEQRLREYIDDVLRERRERLPPEPQLSAPSAWCFLIAATITACSSFEFSTGAGLCPRTLLFGDR